MPKNVIFGYKLRLKFINYAQYLSALYIPIEVVISSPYVINGNNHLQDKLLKNIELFVKNHKNSHFGPISDPN